MNYIGVNMRKLLFLVRVFLLKLRNFINYPLNNYWRLMNELSIMEIWDERLKCNVKRFNIDKGSGYLNYYGTFQSLKKYSGVNDIIPNIHIQHGLYIVGYESTIHSNFIDRSIVFSNLMADRLRKVSNKPILVIGPPILYANDYYTETKHLYLRKLFGRTLLVYIPHERSRKNNPNLLINVVYTLDNILSSIDSYLPEFDTVIINGFSGEEDYSFPSTYRGKRIITSYSGSPNDVNFLSRQRSIIKLADHSISYVISTHVGYFIALNIPHEVINIFKKNYYDISNFNSGLTRNYNESEINLIDCLRHEDSSRFFEEERVLKLFFNTGRKITNKQLHVVRVHWGLGNQKTPEEVKNFIID
jgi:hypothetical protein